MSEKKAFITRATGNIGTYLMHSLKELALPFTAGSQLLLPELAVAVQGLIW